MRIERPCDWALSIGPITPRPAARHRSTRTGRAYTPENTRTYMEIIRAAASAAWPHSEPWCGPMAVEMRGFFPRPKSGPNKKSAFHTSRPDSDNILKAVLDSLTPVVVHGVMVSPGVFVDDRQVCFATVDKFWAPHGEAGRIDLQFWFLGDADAN